MDIHYVIASEFDIDVGSTVKYHYPATDEPMFKPENGFANLLIPDQAHLRQEDSGYFRIYRNKEGLLDYTPSDPDQKPYYVAHILQTKTGEEFKRGARIYSLAIVATECFLPVFKPLLSLAIDAYIINPGVSRLKEVFEALQSVDLGGFPQYSWSEKRVLQMNSNPNLFREVAAASSASLSTASTVSASTVVAAASTAASTTSAPSNHEEAPDTHYYDATAQYRGLRIQVRIPTDMDYYNYGDFSLSKLVDLCAQLPPCHAFHKEMTVYGPTTPALIMLWTSILTEKRILFVGDTETACSELVNLVQACGFFGAAGGLLNTPARVFPYVDLGRMDDLLKAGGYIAGVTNRAFLLHPEWYDLVVHIENKTIELSPHMARSKTPERFPLNNPIDFEMLDKVRRHAREGNERAVRLTCLQYTTAFLRRSALQDLDKMANGLKHRSEGTISLIGEFGHCYSNQAERAQFSTVYVTVFNSWKRHPSYAYYLKQVSSRDWPQPPKPLIDYANLERRLLLGKLDLNQSAEIYDALCEGLQDNSDITLYLAEANSVYYLNLGLYHPMARIRSKVAQLMYRIKEHPAGKHYYAELPPYHVIALERIDRALA